MLVAGIDPGVEGAAVIVDTDALRVVDVIDLPIIRSGAIAWIDGAVLGDWIEDKRPELAIVEFVNHWRGDVAPGRTAVLCRIAGGIEALLSSFSVPIVHCQPFAWKKRAGLVGKDKTASLALAAARLSWPPGGLRLASHQNRAEAGLIAMFGRAPQAAPKPPRRSKVVDAAAAANVPPGPLFGRPAA